MNLYVEVASTRLRHTNNSIRSWFSRLLPTESVDVSYVPQLFFKNLHCYPLYLKVVGEYLYRRKGNHSSEAQAALETPFIG